MALLVAANMILRANSAALAEGFSNAPAKAVTGVFVGLISAMMGIGGGTLSVPILTAFAYDIRKTVGPASAIGLLIAVPGTIGYAITGWDTPGVPAGSIGYVNLLGPVAIIPLTMLFAPLGARVAHHIPRNILNTTFAAFLLFTAARMFLDVLSQLSA